MARTTRTNAPPAWMRQLRRLRALMRASQRSARFVCNLCSLLLAARSRPRTQLWIGDSHTVFFNKAWPCPELSATADGRYVWHIGPRLMWSLAANGMPPRLLRVAWCLHHFGRPANVVPIFVAGEVDVRCHLVPQLEAPDTDLSFVSDYVQVARHAAERMRADVFVVVVPVPPGHDYQDEPGFPIAGTLGQRIDVFERVRVALREAVSAGPASPRAVLLDATDRLVDASGALARELTVDGCHVNERGAQITHECLAALDVGLTKRL